LYKCHTSVLHKITQIHQYITDQYQFPGNISLWDILLAAKYKYAVVRIMILPHTDIQTYRHKHRHCRMYTRVYLTSTYSHTCTHTYRMFSSLHEWQTWQTGEHGTRTSRLHSTIYRLVLYVVTARRFIIAIHFNINI
jgi:hypothetical protein